MRHRCLRLVLGILVSLIVSACGSSPTAPGGTPPQISSIAPTSGSSLGGTAVTVHGLRFTAGATLTIGGVPASSVTVTGPTTLTAVTGAHAIGAADVVVTVDGASAALPGGFTYTAPPPVTNTPPTIASIVAQGTRTREPAQFADLDEEIQVTAVVNDAETPSSALTYQWSSDTAGTFTGTGPSVRWRAPVAGSTPLNAVLTLTVIEDYQEIDDRGLPTPAEHRVTGSTIVSVHDSAKEVGDMATRFLKNFSVSTVPVDVVMQDFTSACAGAAAERSQVVDNRRKFTITDWSVGAAHVTVNFGGVCSFRARPADACSNSAVDWRSTVLADGSTTHVSGTDQVTSVFEGGRWWLCDSDFDGHAAPLGFIK